MAAPPLAPAVTVAHHAAPASPHEPRLKRASSTLHPTQLAAAQMLQHPVDIASWSLSS
jgi:hypothetical protein